eukprot:jgi/Phyca11/511200/fgenesh2_kg.PHYCAscaffold_79_\
MSALTLHHKLAKLDLKLRAAYTRYPSFSGGSRLKLSHDGGCVPQDSKDCSIGWRVRELERM